MISAPNWKEMYFRTSELPGRWPELIIPRRQGVVDSHSPLYPPEKRYG
jgi:hypothetical protein